MPVEWRKSDEAPGNTGAFSHVGGQPYASALLWPHRSLPLPGFAAVMGITFVLIVIPTLPLLGTPVFWGLLPFVMGAVALLYVMIRRNYRDGHLHEELTIWSDRVLLVRTDPRRPQRSWECNPHWIRLSLHQDKGPVEKYLTLKGSGREVELGAFLSPEEREELYDELDHLLKRLPL
ncbi:DUF2244 domain-containing protein [Palleronia caenipelagi]|uniref:DUF2244 domain-containing protein n=1 Tax=Palleronia caenipelagi TaxID=2489174 RepID=A0A547Q5V1_9RHOB|nr:DUF2244 domain-containing protein [Palleronia caenipelagi]TRD21737.1 DUF2244 domain-containing protein [Palleronia caenipelagi]